MICFADQIHAARDVTKVSASALATFQSYDKGALGEVDGARVILQRRPARRRAFRLDRMPELQVPMFRLTLGFDTRIVELALDLGLDGLVIEAFGRGNGSTALVPVVERAVGAGLPVVITSRCRPVGSSRSTAAAAARTCAMPARSSRATSRAPRRACC